MTEPSRSQAKRMYARVSHWAKHKLTFGRAETVAEIRHHVTQNQPKADGGKLTAEDLDQHHADLVVLDLLS